MWLHLLLQRRDWQKMVVSQSYLRSHSVKLYVLLLTAKKINKTRANIKPALTFCVLAGRNTVRGLFLCRSEVAKTVSLCHVLCCNQSCAGKPSSPIRKRLVREQHLSVCERGCRRAAAWYAQPQQTGMCWQLCVSSCVSQAYVNSSILCLNASESKYDLHVWERDQWVARFGCW